MIQIKDSISPFLKNITGYLFMKGLFYLHLVESKDCKYLNSYMTTLHELTQKRPTLHNEIRIVYQSYENPYEFFKGWECDNSPQSGPVLI